MTTTRRKTATELFARIYSIAKFPGTRLRVEHEICALDAQATIVVESVGTTSMILASIDVAQLDRAKIVENIMQSARTVTLCILPPNARVKRGELSKAWFEHHECESCQRRQQRCGTPDFPANGKRAVAGVIEGAGLGRRFGERA